MKGFIIILLIISLLNITWSTQLQNKSNKSGYASHNTGTVCQFGVDSGKVLIVYVILQILTILSMRDEETKKKFIIISSVVVSITFLLMVIMNSSVNYRVRYGFFMRGLWDNTIPFFITQVVAIILVNYL